MKLRQLVSLALVLTFALCAAPSHPSHRRVLHQDTVVQGYPCSQGYAWFYADGHLQSCFVSADTAYGQIRAPQSSVIHLLPDGRPDYVMLQHNTIIAGLHCAGGGVLGPAEGSMTGLYPNGSFKYCFLAQDQFVQGVPCASGGFWKALHSREATVELNENGKLKSCLLSGDFGGLRRGKLYRTTP